MFRKFVSPSILLSLWWLVCSILPAASVQAEEKTLEGLHQEFQMFVVPTLQSHCQACHNADEEEGGLDLTRFHAPQDVEAEHRVWTTVLERVEAGEMPPEDATETLSPEARAKVVSWIEAMLDHAAAENAGDPGPVFARRLSNAEYDYSIRDLTGVDIRPTQTFPVDPANTAGFDNSGESLRMSPALFKKYLEAARLVAEHLVLTPDGIDFAPHPVVTDTDRDKFCVKRIVEFYQRQPTAYSDYFRAAWQLRQDHPKTLPDQAIDDVADELGLSSKYLTRIWLGLTDKKERVGPYSELLVMWQELASATDPQAVGEHCQAMQDFILSTRPHYEPHFENLVVNGIHAGAQAFVLWKNKQYASRRQTAHFDARPTPDSSKQKDQETDAPATDATASDEGDATGDESVPAAPGTSSVDEQQAYIEDCQEFCELFPDAFYISERGRDYLGTSKEKQEKGRLLNAGFHSMMGYFRDDQPLMELILDEAGQRELNQLWQQLDFIASAPQRQYQGFLWFERTDSGYMREEEFDFARPEDQSALQADKIQRLSEVYIAKAIRNGAEEIPLQAIQEYFTEINAQIRWVEETRIRSEETQLSALLDLANRVFRRPLSDSQRDDWQAFYHELREKDQLTHEEAIQDTLVAMLVSPLFSYRVDLLNDSPQARPLNDFELASRLSYFLWSSTPDQELLDCAAAGQLTDPTVLLQQTRRMLQDNKVRGLVNEFGGNWLDIRRFEEHNSVDRERFPIFDDALRTAMFEEPMQFFQNLIQQDSSINEFLNADYTFVNAPLAAHYGIPELDFSRDEWQKVPEAQRFGRGGLLPMAVFLTKNSPGLRTSPVQRGYWVVRRLLGEHIPPPPPNIPELPDDESQLGELTLRETLAKHREHESCASCHNRIDSIGLVFEGFGPIGERRELDLGGHPVDTSASFPDGSQRQGIDELREYIREQRQADFVDNFSRKLLSYGLGRTLLLSDESLLDTMHHKLSADDYRFSALIEAIVTSPQFLNKRGRESLSPTVARNSDEP
ncbi:DUF1592 domain-containing protein [Aureliella helgolandensis]|uniref:Planctomycete cytochrome C n=1 Tax=Aureliella helgolandensis TaxID=2527968 RepID=A0A518GE88_9BACT|nr:DUF1592 domain-containing protein [Aureliella helgolandensis]QDV26858.1 hypothetical protein Q31a_52370 [Aureliella helgolandensis]